MTTTSKSKIRLDVLLVERGLVETRSRAQAQIIAGDVVVNDHLADKPGSQVERDAEIRFKKTSLPYVSRGGFKLAKALEIWPIDISGKICLDIGSSTGGFTDVLLQAGAKKVYAVDVGTNQLAWRLRQNDRVDVREKTHILKVNREDLKPLPQVIVADVSFISLKKILKKAFELGSQSSRYYFLIKPQFELSPAHIEKGGIVRDETFRKLAVDGVLQKASEIGLHLLGFEESPITGTDGNVEYISCFERNRSSE